MLVRQDWQQERKQDREGGGGADVVGENRVGLPQVAALETQNPAARAAAEAAASEAAAELEMQ